MNQPLKLFFLSLYTCIAVSGTSVRAQTVSYKEACQKAVDSSTALKLAAKSVTDARIKRYGAYTYLLPSVKAEGHYTRFNEEISFEIEGMNAVVQPESTKTLSGKLELPLIHLKVPILIRTANFNLLGEQEGLRKALGDILYQTSELYLTILAGKETIVILEQSLANLREHRDISLAKYEIGEYAETAYLQAEYEFAREELRFLKARAALDDLKTSLRILLHYDKEILLTTEDLPGQDLFERSLAKSELVETALLHRPDLKKALAQVKVSEGLKKSVLAEYIPTLSGFFNYDYNLDPTVFSPDEQTWMAGLRIDWPLFDGGSRFIRTKEYDNQIDTATLTHELLTEDITRSINELFNSIKTTKKSLEVNMKQIAVASKNYELVKEQYDVGLATSKDVLDANTSLISAQLSETIDKYNLTRLYINLLNETGELLPYLAIDDETLITITGGKKKAWKKWNDEMRSK